MAKKVGDSAELNYDMNYNLFLLKTSMQNLKTAQGNNNTYLKQMNSTPPLFQFYKFTIFFLCSVFTTSSR